MNVVAGKHFNRGQRAFFFSLAYLVEPRPRDATIEIPSERTNPPAQQSTQ